VVSGACFYNLRHVSRIEKKLDKGLKAVYISFVFAVFGIAIGEVVLRVVTSVTFRYGVVLLLFPVLLLAGGGCGGGGPGVEELEALRETKAAALSAEEEVSELTEEIRELEERLADEERELAEVEAEKEAVEEKLGEMGRVKKPQIEEAAEESEEPSEEEEPASDEIPSAAPANRQAGSDSEIGPGY